MRQDAKLGPRSEQITRITTRELAQAKDAVSLLLEEMQLPAYVFEVEPRNGPWHVRIDCAAGGAWQSLTLSVDSAELIEVVASPAARTKLLERWRGTLGACADPPHQTA